MSDYMSVGDAWNDPDQNWFKRMGDNFRSAFAGEYDGDSIYFNLLEGGLNKITGNRDQANLDREREDLLRENEITREREDTQMVRKVADLEAAGMNPMMLAGNPGAGAPVSQGRTASARSTQGGVSAIQQALSLASFDADLAIKRAQADQLEASAEAQRAAAGKSTAETSVIQRTMDDVVRRAAYLTSEAAANADIARAEGQIRSIEADMRRQLLSAGLAEAQADARIAESKSHMEQVEKHIWRAWQNGAASWSGEIEYQYPEGAVNLPVQIDLTGLRNDYQVEFLLNQIRLDTLEREYKYIPVRAVSGAVSSAVGATLGNVIPNKVVP